MNSRRVIDQAVDAYGLEEAVEIIADVAAYTRDATRLLRSPWPIDLELVIAPYDSKRGPVPDERLPVIGLYDSDFEGVGIGLDSLSKPAAIKRELRAAVLHEGAHVVTTQRARMENPGVGDAGWNLFEEMIDEGKAVHVEAVLCRHRPSSPRYRRYIKATRPQLRAGLEELLAAPVSAEEITDEEIDHFRMGDSEFPRKGYKVGHYVVSRHAAFDNLNLGEVLETPPRDFRAAAERALDDLC